MISKTIRSIWNNKKVAKFFNRADKLLKTLGETHAFNFGFFAVAVAIVYLGFTAVLLSAIARSTQGLVSSAILFLTGCKLAEDKKEELDISNLRRCRSYSDDKIKLMHEKNNLQDKKNFTLVKILVGFDILAKIRDSFSGKVGDRLGDSFCDALKNLTANEVFTIISHFIGSQVYMLYAWLIISLVLLVVMAYAILSFEHKSEMGAIEVVYKEISNKE